MICVVVAMFVAATPAGAHGCSIFNGARADRVSLPWSGSLYVARVNTTGVCSDTARSNLTTAPVLCVVDGRHFGAPGAVPSVVVGVGAADPRQSSDTCVAFSGPALAFEQCTLWLVTGRYFRSAAMVGSESGPEVACAPSD